MIKLETKVKIDEDYIFYKKYRHVGYALPSVPDGWKGIVRKAIIDIEKEMWPEFMPVFLKHLIHYLATGNSAVHVKFWWANKLRDKITGRSIISDIKTKYGTLRINVYGKKEIHDIVAAVTKECAATCEKCEGTSRVKLVGNTGWIYNLCIICAAFNR